MVPPWGVLFGLWLRPCVPMGLRAVAQDQSYRQLCQPGIEVSLAEDKGLLEAKSNVPSLKEPVLALNLGGPLRGDLSMKDMLCIWDRNMQELFSGPHRHVVMVQSTGKPALRGGALRALSLLGLHYGRTLSP